MKLFGWSLNNVEGYKFSDEIMDKAMAYNRRRISITISKYCWYLAGPGHVSGFSTSSGLILFLFRKIKSISEERSKGTQQRRPLRVRRQNQELIVFCKWQMCILSKGNLAWSQLSLILNLLIQHINNVCCRYCSKCSIRTTTFSIPSARCFLIFCLWRIIVPYIAEFFRASFDIWRVILRSVCLSITAPLRIF